MSRLTNFQCNFRKAIREIQEGKHKSVSLNKLWWFLDEVRLERTNKFKNYKNRRIK